MYLQQVLFILRVFVVKEKANGYKIARLLPAPLQIGFNVDVH